MEPLVRRQLRDILSAAFTRKELEMLAEDWLGTRLSHITGETNDRVVVFELIGWTESEGKTLLLIEGAVSEKPGNQALQAFVAEHAPTVRRPEPVPVSSPPPAPSLAATPEPRSLEITFEDTEFLTTTALRYRCDRQLLLAWLPGEVVDQLTTLGTPANQIASDVGTLSLLKLADQAHPPLYYWVRNLASMVRSYPEAGQVNALLAKLQQPKK